MPAIRAAQNWGKRPTAVITRDDWAGHRHPLTGEEMGDKDEWTSWDHALAGAFQTIEDYSDEYGLLVWERDDEAFEVEAVRKIHPFKRAVDEATRGTEKKPYKPRPGEYFVPKVWSRREDEEGRGVFQTFREWVESQVDEGQS